MSLLYRTSKRVAFLLEQEFEDLEFKIPDTALRRAGAEVVVLGGQMCQAYRGRQGKVNVEPDGTTAEAGVERFAAIVIPGGRALDRMRLNRETIRFVQTAMNQGSIIATLDQGPQVLIEANLLRGRNATGAQAIRVDMQNAGARYIDEPLVMDSDLITSRRLGDIPIFTATILTRLGLSVNLPHSKETALEWWELGKAWGGSSRTAILEAINLVISLERTGLTTFEQTLGKLKDQALVTLFQEISARQRDHLQSLTARLVELNGGEPEETASSRTAALSGQEGPLTDIAVLRLALDQLQVELTEIQPLLNQLTDPITTAIFAVITTDLSNDQQRLADAYHHQIAIRSNSSDRPVSSHR